MKKATKLIIGIIIVVLVIWGIYAIVTAPKEPVSTGPIKIGFIGPLTGDMASAGENMQVAVEIARDKINQAGGINGREVQVIFEDGQCGPTEAANAGNKLINIDNVVAIVGGVCSSETLAVAPMAEERKVVLISAASTNPDISEAGDYIFRVLPSDSFQGVFSAQYVKNELNNNRVALLKCLSDWCLGVNDAFKAEFQRLGGEIVVEESFPQESKDLRSQLTKIKAQSPELIYFVSYTEASIVGLKQMKELGITAGVFGADAWNDPKVWEEVGEIGDGAMYLEPANKDLPPEFITEMNERTGGPEIIVYSPRAYDALMILASVMEKKGADPTAIKSALYKVQDYQGIADNYTFDSNGDILGAKYLLKRIEGGKQIDAE